MEARQIIELLRTCAACDFNQCRAKCPYYPADDGCNRFCGVAADAMETLLLFHAAAGKKIATPDTADAAPPPPFLEGAKGTSSVACAPVWRPATVLPPMHTETDPDGGKYLLSEKLCIIETNGSIRVGYCEITQRMTTMVPQWFTEEGSDLAAHKWTTAAEVIACAMS